MRPNYSTRDPTFGVMNRAPLIFQRIPIGAPPSNPAVCPVTLSAQRFRFCRGLFECVTLKLKLVSRVRNNTAKCATPPKLRQHARLEAFMGLVVDGKQVRSLRDNLIRRDLCCPHFGL